MREIWEQHDKNLVTHSEFPEGYPHLGDLQSGKVIPNKLNNFVTVFATRHSDPLTIAYEAYCSGLVAVEVTVNLEGSVNFEVSPDLKWSDASVKATQEAAAAAKAKAEEEAREAAAAKAAEEAAAKLGAEELGVDPATTGEETAEPAATAEGDATAEPAPTADAEATATEGAEATTEAAPTEEAAAPSTTDDEKKESTGPIALTRMVAIVRPFQRTYIGFIKVIDEYKRSGLKCAFTWKYLPVTEEESKNYFDQHRAHIQAQLDVGKAANFPPTLEDPNALKVNQICEEKKIRFVDLEFPPLIDSLDYDPATQAITDGLKQIEWKRPQEFMKADEPIEVFSGSIAAADIIQGGLGDCWFLSALAALTEFPELVKDLFIDASEHYNKNGCYDLQFYKNGLDRVVRLDDFFPCNPGIMNGPKYSRCNGNELWVLLAEKGFAKMHGSYAAICAGFTSEALMDLTGCPVKTYRLDDSQVKPFIEDGTLWKELCSYDEQKFVLSASTPGVDPTQTGGVVENTTGLVPGHAYTLVACVEFEGYRLCQLRNPWGSLEWTGDWSDHSDKWTPELRKKLDEKMDSGRAEGAEDLNAAEVKDDGLFWMSFEDMCNHFNSVSVCMVRHKAYNDKPWNVNRQPFYFDFDLVSNMQAAAAAAGNTPTDVEDAATGYGKTFFKIRNPLYALKVEEDGEFVFSVHQEDQRCRNAKRYIDIGVAVVKVDPERKGKYHLIAGTGITADRQSQTDVINLPAGDYLVVPLTSGSKLRAAWAEEQLKEGGSTDASAVEAAASGPVAKVDLLETKPGSKDVVFTEPVIAAFKEVFKHLDTDGDGYLNKAEFDQYMIRTEGINITKAAFDWLLNTFGGDEEEKKKGLNCDGFISAQLHMFKEKGGNQDRLLKEFRAVGFDNSLVMVNGRPCALSIHGTAKYTLSGLPFDDNAVTEAQEMVVQAYGVPTKFDEDRIAIYTYRAGYYGVSVMVENLHTVPLVFSLDVSSSENVVSHRGVLMHTDMIPPGEKVVFHHLAPKVMEESWTWAYSASFMWDSRPPKEAEANPLIPPPPIHEGEEGKTMHAPPSHHPESSSAPIEHTPLPSESAAPEATEEAAPATEEAAPVEEAPVATEEAPVATEEAVPEPPSTTEETTVPPQAPAEEAPSA